VLAAHRYPLTNYRAQNPKKTETETQKHEARGPNVPKAKGHANALLARQSAAITMQFILGVDLGMGAPKCGATTGVNLLMCRRCEGEGGAEPPVDGHQRVKQP